MNINIKSDGTASGTRVTLADGTELPGVARIDLSPIEPYGEIKATITMPMVRIDIDADAEFSPRLWFGVVDGVQVVSGFKDDIGLLTEYVRKDVVQAMIDIEADNGPSCCGSCE